MSSVTAFRLANWDTPLWVAPNRRASRYFSAGVQVVQYWSLHPLTPWAEHLRYHGVRDPDEAGQLLVRPWVATLDLPAGLLDLTFDNAAEHGLDPGALVEDDWSECQRWAASLTAPGLLVPSAALPGTRNLVLFGPRVRSRYGLPPTRPDLDVPCDPVAEWSVVLGDLLDRIRWRGDPHKGYEAWQAGADEPLPPIVTVSRAR